MFLMMLNHIANCLVCKGLFRVMPIRMEDYAFSKYYIKRQGCP